MRLILPYYSYYTLHGPQFIAGHEDKTIYKIIPLKGIKVRSYKFNLSCWIKLMKFALEIYTTVCALSYCGFGANRRKIQRASF